MDPTRPKMDPTRPDELSKALATPVSRRKALKALAAIAGASGLAALPNSLEIAGLDPGARAALAKEMQDEPATGGSKLTGRLVFPNSPNYESARVL
jgi:hypothetical protein